MRAAFVSFAPLLAGVAAAALPGAAAAACGSGCPSCCLPSTHQVIIPGIEVTPPTLTIAPPAIAMSGVGVSSGVDVSVSTSVTTQNTATATSAGTATASSSATAGAVSSGAVANLVSGGGGVFVETGGPTSSFGTITVESPQPPGPPVCLQWRASASTVALQAVCLDDKAVPHPASQVNPERDIAPGYEGEVFRCIAGSHMQYTLGSWTGQARFENGQTVVCDKAQALWREASGRLVCRPQRPARDCNERSLLRRYGAGIKLVSSSARVCVQWSGGVASVAQSGAGEAIAPGFNGDGGVGR